MGRGRTWTKSGTASAVALRPLVGFSLSRGIDIDAILAGVGLTRGELDDYDRRIPERSRAAVWVEAAARGGDPDFGLQVAEHAPRGSYDVLAYAVRFSATVGDAAECVVRFHRVMCDAWAIALEPEGSEVGVRLVEATPPPATEEYVARIVLTVRQLTGTDITPVDVRFRHRAPSIVEHHARLFRCPVRFDQPVTAIVFRRGDFALPGRQADAGVAQVLRRYLGEILERLPRSQSFAERARVAVPPACARVGRRCGRSRASCAPPRGPSSAACGSTARRTRRSSTRCGASWRSAWSPRAVCRSPRSRSCSASPT